MSEKYNCKTCPIFSLCNGNMITDEDCDKMLSVYEQLKADAEHWKQLYPRERREKFIREIKGEN